VSTVKTKNVTLSLPEPLMRRFKVFAAEKDKSMSALMTELLAQALDGSNRSQREKSRERLLKRMRNSPDRGTGGVFNWTRDELHER
jgi:plasmid stability protein